MDRTRCSLTVIVLTALLAGCGGGSSTPPAASSSPSSATADGRDLVFGSAPIGMFTDAMFHVDFSVSYLASSGPSLDIGWDLRRSDGTLAAAGTLSAVAPGATVAAVAMTTAADGETFTLRIDPDNRIAETSELNNTVGITAYFPQGTGGTTTGGTTTGGTTDGGTTGGTTTGGSTTGGTTDGSTTGGTSSGGTTTGGTTDGSTTGGTTTGGTTDGSTTGGTTSGGTTDGSTTGGTTTSGSTTGGTTGGTTTSGTTSGGTTDGSTTGGTTTSGSTTGGTTSGGTTDGSTTGGTTTSGSTTGGTTTSGTTTGGTTTGGTSTGGTATGGGTTNPAVDVTFTDLHYHGLYYYNDLALHFYVINATHSGNDAHGVTFTVRDGDTVIYGPEPVGRDGTTAGDGVVLAPTDAQYRSGAFPTTMTVVPVDVMMPDPHDPRRPAPGLHQFSVTLDAAGDTNIANNTRYFTVDVPANKTIASQSAAVDKPDIQLNDPHFHQYAKEVYFHFFIKDVQRVGNPSPTVGWRIVREEDGAVIFSGSGTVAPGGLLEVPASGKSPLRYSETAPGSVTYRLTLDPDNAIDETDETDNTVKFIIDWTPQDPG